MSIENLCGGTHCGEERATAARLAGAEVATARARGRIALLNVAMSSIFV